MSKQISSYVEERIRYDLAKGELSKKLIALRWSVTNNTVVRIEELQTMYSRRHERGIHFFHKDEPYSTEEEMLKGLPTYTCKNRHLMKSKLPKGEKLYTVINEPLKEEWKLK